MDDINPSKKLGPGWDHLFLKDTRPSEEKQGAEAKESARRRSRKTKGWHLKYLDEDGRPKD